MKNLFKAQGGTRAFRRRVQSPGFALVVTLSLMVLLAILAVGLLSLSAITLRSSGHGSAQAEARANARMALMVAIGELQKQMGPDQRISANGAILSDSTVKHPHWTGVWDSWIAGSLAEAPVNESYPDGNGESEESHHQTIGPQPIGSMRPAYRKKDAHFRAWLLSLDPGEAEQIDLPLSLTLDGAALPGKTATAVRLVGQGSLDPDAEEDFVSARLLKVKQAAVGARAGRYAWWVGDESQKARIMSDSYAASPAASSAERIFRSQAPGSTGTTSLSGLETITEEEDLATLETELASLPSFATLDLLTNAAGRPARDHFHHASLHACSVLADVREGGLKRDLSALLERPIDTAEKGDEYMLYKFDTKDAWATIANAPETPQECVPIQDLAAFYQLYDESRKGGVQYSSTHLADSIQTMPPNYGTTATYQTAFQRQYTSIYRNPVPIKVQFLISLTAEPITAADKAYAISGVRQNFYVPESDTHKLRIAVFPAITMWNPYNVPIVMQTGNDFCQQFVLKPPAFYFTCVKSRAAGGTYTAPPLNMPYALSSGSVNDGRGEPRSELIKLNLGRLVPMVFQPGEVKVISMPNSTSGLLYNSADSGNNSYTQTKNLWDAEVGWNSSGYFTAKNSVVARGGAVTSESATYPASHQYVNTLIEVTPTTPSVQRRSITIADGDTLTFTINGEALPVGGARGMRVTEAVAPTGAALCFYMGQRNFTAAGYNYLNLRHHGVVSRMSNTTDIIPFNNQLIAQGMPGGLASVPLEAIPASDIIGAAAGGETYPFLQMAIMAGSETSELANGGPAAGRKFPGRPFLHSSPIQPGFIDQNDASAPYNHGWNWWLEDMNSILEALVQESATGNGYYGGGLSVENGATHVIQQELPVTPPISIAALSHARLGGFTLANEVPIGQGLTGSSQMEGYGPNASIGGISNPTPTKGFQRVTATGQAGLYPQTLQAIGNSYAHPNLEPDAAYDTAWKRTYDMDDGEREVTFADHSYLANKALWDEFFFSSITPSTTLIFEGANRTALQTAEDFFFSQQTLPNRRMTAYMGDLDGEKLTELFGQASVFTGGLADKIAAHLMVEGGFNVNSTSVEAWKVLFSSLRGKPVPHLESGVTPDEATPSGIPVGQFSLPNAEPIEEDGVTGPNTPPEQWKASRELSETEIEELAVAMVKQVKLRGPFLSLSEFVNRRLDAEDEELALKGALQAALDDEEVSINEDFRGDDRILDSETDNIDFPFDAAANGPIAYGSSAYVDQADVMRGLAEQLTPRGDTFVIRAYGDALDAEGDVLARAWCEAVVQRIPEYVNSGDEAHLKQADPALSMASKTFGRKMRITGFRWLNPKDV